MPERPLPEKLIERLRKNAEGIRKSMGSMKNLDYRFHPQSWLVKPKNPAGIYTRVRRMRVDRNFPDVKLVIKHADSASAEKTINEIREIVARHNEKSRGTDIRVSWSAYGRPSLQNLLRTEQVPYELRAPYAYAISKDLIAMAETDKPSPVEVLGKRLWEIDWSSGFQPIERTEHGEAFFKELTEKHEVTEEQLLGAVARVMHWTNGNITPNNLLLLGFEKGKFIFMPLVDLV